MTRLNLLGDGGVASGAGEVDGSGRGDQLIHVGGVEGVARETAGVLLRDELGGEVARLEALVLHHRAKEGNVVVYTLFVQRSRHERSQEVEWKGATIPQLRRCRGRGSWS